MKFHEVGVTNRDAQFLESRKFKITGIARLFRLPSHLIADLGAGDVLEHRAAEVRILDANDDAMGRAVTGLDVNCDGYSDLSIGAPGDHVNGLLAAGGVNVIYGSAGSLNPFAGPGNQLFTQDSPNMLGDPQAGALFGSGFTGLPAGGCGAGGTCTE